MRTTALTVALLSLLACGGCVTRTVRRTPRISDLAAGTRLDENGMIVEKKTIWIWER